MPINKQPRIGHTVEILFLLFVGTKAKARCEAPIVSWLSCLPQGHLPCRRTNNTIETDRGRRDRRFDTDVKLGFSASWTEDTSRCAFIVRMNAFTHVVDCDRIKWMKVNGRDQWVVESKGEKNATLCYTMKWMAWINEAYWSTVLINSIRMTILKQTNVLCVQKILLVCLCNPFVPLEMCIFFFSCCSKDNWSRCLNKAGLCDHRKTWTFPGRTWWTVDNFV